MIHYNNTSNNYKEIKMTISLMTTTTGMTIDHLLFDSLIYINLYISSHSIHMQLIKTICDNFGDRPFTLLICL